MIKGVFFDVGGTLYSYKSMKPAENIFLERLAEKLEHDHAEVVEQFHLAGEDAVRVIMPKPFYLIRDFFEMTFTNLLARIGKPNLQHHFDWYEERQRDTLVKGMQLMAGCHEALGSLKDMGLYLAAVSNADENHLQPLVERGQFQRWLTHWTSSEAAGACKPNREFFEIALRKSGLPADQIMFVGDSLEQDIAGAHAMGMTTVLISETGGPSPGTLGVKCPDPNFKISKLSELPGIISKLNTH
jgi:HAD superfamily hydrolase (TIGR01509 family)